MTPFEYFESFMNTFISGLNSISFYGVTITSLLLAMITSVILVNVIRSIKR